MSWEQDLHKILHKIVNKKESEVFREPVDWKKLGIPDYPVIIKKPMDLSTVQKKLDSREYRRQDEAAVDVRLIWSNAMLYNAGGSRIYQMAKNMSEYWEREWQAVSKEKDDDRPPTTEETNAWVDMCHRVTPEQLGSILVTLDSLAPHAMVKKGDVNEVEVNVDLIPGRVFREMQATVQKLLPDVLSRRKQKRSDLPESSEGGGASSGGGRGGGGGEASSDRKSFEKGPTSSSSSSSHHPNKKFK